MRSNLLTLVVLIPLVACGGGENDAGFKVFKSMGSLQCSGGGVSLAVLQSQLTANSVQAGSAACGVDGLARPAACGYPDGKIGIFEISPTQAGAAAAAGFTPLNALPEAKTIACT